MSSLHGTDILFNLMFVIPTEPLVTEREGDRRTDQVSPPYGRATAGMLAYNHEPSYMADH